MFDRSYQAIHSAFTIPCSSPSSLSSCRCRRQPRSRHRLSDRLLFSFSGTFFVVFLLFSFVGGKPFLVVDDAARVALPSLQQGISLPSGWPKRRLPSGERRGAWGIPGRGIDAPRFHRERVRGNEGQRRMERERKRGESSKRQERGKEGRRGGRATEKRREAKRE